MLSAVVGVAAGGAAYLLVRLIGLLTSLALLGEWHWGDIPPLADLEPSARLPIAAVGGAFIVAGMAMWAPQIRGHGIPETMEAVLRRQSRISPRTGLAKPTSAAVAIGTGAPFGAEGPVIVTGGAIGSLVGQVLDVTPSERKILLASGAAAGMAATFGAPLASVLLAIELLLFELSVRSLIPLVVAASVAGGIHSAIFGTGPLFVVPPHEYAGLSKFPLYVVLGLACGLLAVVIAEGLFRTESLFRALPIPQFWHPAIGAVVFAGIGLVVPRSLGVGYDVIDDVLAGNLAIGALSAVLVAKTAAWWVALSSGTSGGTLAPILLMSASFGGLFAAAANEISGIEVNTGAFAVVAMAATFGAATRAPLTALVFVFELTRDFDVLLPLMLATVLAALVSTWLLQDSVFTEKLSRRNIRVGGELKADPLRTAAVADVMNRMVDTLHPDAVVGEALERIARGGRGAYPLVDENRTCVGIVTRRDLIGQRQDADTKLVDVASTDVVTIRPDASLLDALQLMVDEDISHLPVTQDGELIGICTRADILRARNEELALERVEPGWLAPTLRRRARRDTPTYLLVANRTLLGEALAREIRARADTSPRPIFHLLVPVTPDGDLASARQRLERQLGWLEELGVEASGEIGDPDAFDAILDVVRRQDVDQVILSTLQPGASRWLRSDLPSRLQRALDVPVVHVVADEDTVS